MFTESSGRMPVGCFLEFLEEQLKLSYRLIDLFRALSFISKIFRVSCIFRLITTRDGRFWVIEVTGCGVFLTPDCELLAVNMVHTRRVRADFQILCLRCICGRAACSHDSHWCIICLVADFHNSSDEGRLATAGRTLDERGYMLRAPKTMDSCVCLACRETGLDCLNLSFLFIVKVWEQFGKCR